MKNVSVRTGWRLAAAGLAASAALSACSSSPPPNPPDTTPNVSAPSDRDQLASLAAAAKDRRYIATYIYSVPDQPDRTVTVAIATDDSWVVAVPGGALGGLADIAIFKSVEGLFQCALGPAPGALEARPDLPPVTPGCVKVTALTPATDPRVQHIFTDWIDPLVDRATALSVTAADPLPGARGACYSVESTSAALAPPVDPGIYCYDQDGILTAAQVRFGTLMLTGEVQPAPPSVAQPAGVVARDPLPIAPPPPPPPPQTTPATPAPSRG